MYTETQEISIKPIAVFSGYSLAYSKSIELSDKILPSSL
jgi:hypothetical protein